MTLLLGCAEAPAPPPAPPAAAPVAVEPAPAPVVTYTAPAYAVSGPIPHLETQAARSRYGRSRTELEAARVALAARLDAGEWPDKVLAEAHQVLFEAIRGKLIPAWFGTQWAFFGTSVVPGEGAIACGYFVSTILEHAGLHVERVKLAKQASERIVRTFTPPEDVYWLRHPTPEQVEASLTRDGIYIVGLDGHVGMLSRETVAGVPKVEFCNSAYVDHPEVACEDPTVSESFHSRSYVIGELLGEGTVRAWVTGAPFPTWRPGT